MGNRPGSTLISMTRDERKAMPMNAATKTISIVSPRLSLSIIDALLRAEITASPVIAIV